MSLEIDFGGVVIRSAPIAGAVASDATARLLGLTLHEWFYVAAIAYTVVQGVVVIVKLKRGGKE